MAAPFAIFYSLSLAFVWHGERIALVAVVMMAAYFLVEKFGGRRAHALLVAGLLWLGFALWEIVAAIGKWDIRVDLLLIWPVVVAALLVGIGQALFLIGRPRPRIEGRP